MIRIIGNDQISLDWFEKKAGDKITRSINREFGDPKISGISHPQRLPGFANAKPYPENPLTDFKYGTKSEDGTWNMWRVRIVRAEYQLCEKTRLMFLDALSAQMESGRRAEVRKSRPGEEEKGVTLVSSPNAAKLARWHYVDVLRRAKLTPLSANWSAVDFMVACRLRVQNFSAGETAYAISQESPNARPAGNNHHQYNFPKYAGEVAAAVFILPDNAPQISRLKPYLQFWPPC